jgi:MFS family permease
MVELPSDRDASIASATGVADRVLPRAYYTLFVLGAVNFLCSTDRLIVGMLIEPIRHELQLTDGQMGFLSGMAYAIFNALALLPLGIAADRFARQKVIALCLTLWSAMTLLSGFARNFVQLCLCRIFVGIGEAGNSAPGLSVISDYFPPHRRAFAISIFYMASSLGMLATFAGGSWIAEHFGWRAAMVATGVPGLGVALLMWLTVRDPVRGEKGKTPDAVSIVDTARIILNCRSLVHTIGAITLVNFVVCAVGIWAAAFFMRTHNLAIGEAGQLIALSAAVGMVGSLSGGFVSDQLSRRDPRWPAWLSAGAVVIVFISMMGLCLAHGLRAAMSWYFLFAFFQTFYLSPSYSLIQLLAPSRIRATVNAFHYLICGVLGFGLGPFVTGALSQWLSDYGSDALRYSLLIVSTVLLWGALHFQLVAGSLRDDLKIKEAE